MRLAAGFVIFAIVSIASPISADWCSAKCDAIFYFGETALKSTILAIIPGSRNRLNSWGMRTGNRNHDECMGKCGSSTPSQICKKHCDFRFSLGKYAFKVAPSGVVEVSEALGFGVSEEQYQKCVTDCMST